MTFPQRSTTWVRRTKPSPPPSALSHSPRPAGRSPCRALVNWRLGLASHAQGDYCRAIDCYGQTVAFFDGARRPRALRSGLPARCAIPCLSPLGAMPSWAHLPRAGFWAKKGCQIAEAVDHPASLMLAYYGIGLLSLRQGGPHRQASNSNGLWASVRTWTSRSILPGWRRPWGQRTRWVWRVTDAVPLLTQAMERDHCHGKESSIRGSCSLSLGEAHPAG